MDNAVTVDYATADGTAHAGQDYVATSGTLTFAPHERTHTVDVTVNGGSGSDATTFFLNLSNESSGTLVRQQATVTISPSASPPPPPPPVHHCVVPRVVGLRLAAARTRIRRAHCRVGKVTRKTSVRRKTGRVLAQSPRPGRRFAAGHKVALVVGRGPRKR